MKKLFLMIFVACYALAYEDTDNSNVSVEIGIGYLNTTFTGKQSGYYNRTSKGSARGVDMYAAVNVYATERLGISLGMGAEFLNGDWNDECSNGVGAYNYSYTRKVVNLYLAKTNDNSQRYKEELAAITEVAGNDYDKAFDASKKFDPNLTGSQGYLDRKEYTRNKYEVKYSKTQDEQGNANGNYALENGNYVYKGTGKEQYSREIQYVFQDAGTGQGAYKQTTESKENTIKGTDGNTYEYVGEGNGDYTITQEEYYLYRYNGATYDSRGLYCGTPKLNVKAWYMFLGAFYDVVRFDYFGVRVFGNIGVGYDMMKDKFNRATSFYDAGDYQTFYTYNTNETPSQEQGSVFIPLTAGLRFIIAKNHGIELVGKYNLLKSKWKGTQTLYSGEFDGKNHPQLIGVDTKITRDYSWGIRYVYEFRND